MPHLMGESPKTGGDLNDVISETKEMTNVRVPEGSCKLFEYIFSNILLQLWRIDIGL